MYVIEINKLHAIKILKKQNMIELSDQNMATKSQCYKDREDCSSRRSSLLCGPDRLFMLTLRTYLKISIVDHKITNIIYCNQFIFKHYELSTLIKNIKKSK